MDKIDRHGSLVIKIREGTRSGKALCATCKSGHVLKGSGQSQVISICDRQSNSYKPPFEVVECNCYSNKATPSIHEMEDVAWVLRTKGAGRRIGFVSPQQRKKEEGEE